MIEGKFNTDANALKKRIEIHEKFGSKNLNQWIFEQLDLKEGMVILDLGCGTGKQTIPMAQVVKKKGHLYSIDISKEALFSLQHSAKQLGVDRRISLICGELDKLSSYFQGRDFDRVLSCYSLYYAKNPKSVLSTIYRFLKKEGVLFFCGPAKNNNAELKEFHYSLQKKQPRIATDASIFMEDESPRLVNDLFDKVESCLFENILHFRSAEDLFNYWSSYNLYDEDFEDDFRKAANKYFQTRDIFETVKLVVGIKAIK